MRDIKCDRCKKPVDEKHETYGYKICITNGETNCHRSDLNHNHPDLCPDCARNFCGLISGIDMRRMDSAVEWMRNEKEIPRLKTLKDIRNEESDDCYINWHSLKSEVIKWIESINKKGIRGIDGEVCKCGIPYKVIFEVGDWEVTKKAKQKGFVQGVKYLYAGSEFTCWLQHFFDISDKELGFDEEVLGIPKK